MTYNLSTKTCINHFDICRKMAAILGGNPMAALGAAGSAGKQVGSFFKGFGF
jgi:hypothetical protein